MELETITLSIDKETLCKLKLLAARRQTTVSELLVQVLKRAVERKDAYEAARECHLRQLEQGYDLGTEGHVMGRRDELHGRV